MKAVLSVLRYAYIGAKLMENMRPSNSVDVSAYKALIYQLARGRHKALASMGKVTCASACACACVSSCGRACVLVSYTNV